MEEPEIFNLNVRSGSKVPTNDKNGLERKNSCTGNSNSYLCQSRCVQFYCCKQQKANMENVNQRELIKAGRGLQGWRTHRIKRKLKYTRFGNDPESRMQGRQQRYYLERPGSRCQHPFLLTFSWLLKSWERVPKEGGYSQARTNPTLRKENIFPFQASLGRGSP